VSSVLVAIAVEQIPMAEFPVASAVAMNLCEQRRIFRGNPVGLTRHPEKRAGSSVTR
jgi:hypothetical protein